MMPLSLADYYNEKSKAKIPADAAFRIVRCIECATNKHYKHNGAMLRTILLQKFLHVILRKTLLKKVFPR